MSNMAINTRTTKGLKPKSVNPLKTNNLSIVGTDNSKKAAIRNKVLIRKRKRSKHPLRELRIRSGCTLEGLAETTKLSPSYLSRLECGSRRLNADIIQRLSLALSCSPAELLPYSSYTGTSYAPPSVPSNSQGTSATVDLPVYKIIGEGSAHGALDKKHAEQWIARPTDFVGISDAFACSIDGNQWSPRYMDGDRLLIHPTAPLKPGCAVLVMNKDGKSFIGTFKGTKGEGVSKDFKIETSFSTPVKMMSFKQSDIKTAYRITGTIDVS